MKTYLGIDPGKGGSIAAVSDEGQPLCTLPLSESITDVWDWLRLRSFGDVQFAILERVSSSPQMGVASAFTFGRGYGQLEALLITTQIPFDRVTPQVWQRNMKCLTKGDKNISKARAQELFPGVKITHKNADALLIAEYARRLRMQGNSSS